MTGAYKKELRENRDKFLADLRSKYGALPPDVERHYLLKMIAIQNETRGKLGELFGEISWTATGQAEEVDIIRDAVVFETPYGKRSVDVWHTLNNHALEVKSGYSCLNKFTRNQIKKDAFLLEHGLARKISWRLMKGGSKPLMRLLKSHDFEVLEGWPDLDESLLDAKSCIEQSLSVSKNEIL